MSRFIKKCKLNLGLEKDDLQNIIDKMFKIFERIHLGIATSKDDAKYETKIYELQDLLRLKGLWPTPNREEECLREIHERIQNILCSFIVKSEYTALLLETELKELLFPTQPTPTYPERPYLFNRTRLKEDDIHDKQQYDVDIEYGPDAYSGDDDVIYKKQDGGKRKTRKSRKTKRSKKTKGKNTKRRR